MDFFIVEDDKVLSLILSKMVQKIGYEVSGTSEYGSESIKKIKENKPSVILMDIALKDQVDGITVASEVTKLYSPAIIYITGNTDESTRKRAEEFGYHEFLAKPVDFNQLKSSIMSI